MKIKINWLIAFSSLLLLIGMVILIQNRRTKPAETYTGFAMNTLITQKAYGRNAAQAEAEVQRALQEFESRTSMFQQESEIAQINAAAGKHAVKVSPETMRLLQKGLELSGQSDGSFQLSIAPVTKLWGVTSENPKVPGREELNVALELVNDEDIILNLYEETVYLRREGQALDFGGIAKGAACSLAEDIYEKEGIDSAVLSIGGNIYVKGKKPDGMPFRIGFRDPAMDENSYLASFSMEDMVLAVSGGYERYFEENDIRYHHIIDPATGYPANSDIVSVGVFSKDGAKADFLSTSLFVMGSKRTLSYMEQTDACDVVFLDSMGDLYVSENLKPSFQLEEAHRNVNVTFVEKKER